MERMEAEKMQAQQSSSRSKPMPRTDMDMGERERMLSGLPKPMQKSRKIEMDTNKMRMMKKRLSGTKRMKFNKKTY